MGGPADRPLQPEGKGGPPIVDAWHPPEHALTRVAEVSRDQVRLSLRVVVHLHRAGPPGEDEVARLESTQQGLVRSLGVTQGAVSKILSRLVAAEVIRQERRHVRGLNRRVRAYFLTARGLALAREIEAALGLSR
jgi:DNA-binding PadR family transcriptional regulator